MAKQNDENYLFISDLQIPFEHKDSLEFCKYVKKHYKIPDSNVYNVGDEVDCYWGGQWPKDINATLTATQELEAAREILSLWFEEFPQMKLCTSNHGDRWMRKALAAEIPDELMKSIKKIYNAPPGWKWKKQWKIKGMNPIIVEHGDDWGGQQPHTKAAIHNACSTVMGHHHSKACITHVKTSGQEVWGMVVGSLIDFDSFAFKYAKKATFKPLLGVGVALDGGRTPIWIPLD